MSEESAKQLGLKIGQKALYPHSASGYSIYMEIVTIKDVAKNYDDEIVILVEEHEGYLNFSDIYTQNFINKMFEFENKKKIKMKSPTIFIVTIISLFTVAILMQIYPILGYLMIVVLIMSLLGQYVYIKENNYFQSAINNRKRI